HVGRELWARDHDRLVFLEPQQAKKLLGRLDISDHNGDVVEVFDHGLCSCHRLALSLSSLKQTVIRALRSPSRCHQRLPTSPLPGGRRTLGLSRCRKPKRGTSVGSGKEAVSPSPPPLRTARASFPACRSSRLTGSDALSVSLTMTSGVEPLEVLAF